jgi:predicted nucleic acid-binding protein
MNTGIIADTCIWIEFFRKPDAALTVHLKHLIREEKVVMTGMVLAEILQGIKAQKEAGLVRDHLQKLPYLETTRKTWENAGQLSASLRARGITIPLSDLIIAATAMSHGCEVFTVDPHFDQVKELKRHHAE